MTKMEYLNKLKELCTQEQIDLFNRMYPTGIKGDQLAWATIQLEDTLKDLNATSEEVDALKKQLKEAKFTIKTLEETEHGDIENLVEELKSANARIHKLNNPISVDNVHIQERLALLDALNAFGVANWNGYEDAVRSCEESVK